MQPRHTAQPRPRPPSKPDAVVAGGGREDAEAKERGSSATAAAAAAAAPSALHSYRSSLLRSCDLPSWVHSGGSLLPGSLASRTARSSMFVRPALLQPPRVQRTRQRRSWEILQQQEEAERAEEKAAEGAAVKQPHQQRARTDAAAGSTAPMPRFHGLADVRFRADRALLPPRSAAVAADALPSHAAASHTAAASSSTAVAVAAPAVAAAAAPSNVFPYTAATASPEFQAAFHRVAAQSAEALLSKERIEVYTKRGGAAAAAAAAATGDDDAKQEPQQPHHQTAGAAAVASVWPPVDFTDGSVVIARFEQLKGSGNRVADSGAPIHLSPAQQQQQQQQQHARHATSPRSNVAASNSAAALPESFGPAVRLASAAAASSRSYNGGKLGSPPAAPSSSAAAAAAAGGSQSAPRGSVATHVSSPKQQTFDASDMLPLTSPLAPARYVHPPKLPGSSTALPAVAASSALANSTDGSRSALAPSPSALSLVAAHLSVAARSPAATRLAHGSDSPEQLLAGVVANGGVFLTAASAAAAAAASAGDSARDDAAISSVHPPPHPPATAPPSLMKLTGIEPGTTERQVRWCFESVGVEVRRVRMQGLYAAATGMDSFGVAGGDTGGDGGGGGFSGGEARLRSNASGSDSCALVEYFPRGLPARRIKRQVYERLYRLQGGEGSAAEMALRALTKRAGGLGDAPRFFGLDSSPSVLDRRARLLSKVAADMDVPAKLFMLMSSTPQLNAVTHRVDRARMAHTVDMQRARDARAEAAVASKPGGGAPESNISKELSSLFAQGGDAWMDGAGASSADSSRMQHIAEAAQKEQEEAEEEQRINASAQVPPPLAVGSSALQLARSHSRKRSSLLMDPTLSAGEAILSISVDSSATLARALSPRSHHAAAAAAAAAAIEASAQQQHGKRDSDPRSTPSPSSSSCSSDLVSPHRALQFSLHRRATADRARDTKHALRSQALEEHAASLAEEEQSKAAAVLAAAETAAAAAAASAAHDEREFVRAARRAERAAHLGVTADDDEDAHLLRDEAAPGSESSRRARQLPLQLHHIAAATRSSPRASRFRVPLSSLVPSLAPSSPFHRASTGGSSPRAAGSPSSALSASPPGSVPGSPGVTVVSIALHGIAGSGSGSGGCDSGSIPSSPVVSSASPRFQARPMTHVNARKLAEFQAKMDALHSPASAAASIQQQAVVAARKAATTTNNMRRKG